VYVLSTKSSVTQERGTDPSADKINCPDSSAGRRMTMN